MEIDNKITVTLTKDDIEQACKAFVVKEFDGIEKPSFESLELTEDGCVITYKGYP